jgi:hypothetical protein
MGTRTLRVSLIGLLAAVVILFSGLPHGSGSTSQPLPTGAEILVEGCDASLGWVNLAHSSRLEEATSGVPVPVLVDNNLTSLQAELGAPLQLITATTSVGPVILVEHASAVYSLPLSSSDEAVWATGKAATSILVEHPSGVTVLPLVTRADIVPRSVLVEHSRSVMVLQLSAPPEGGGPGESGVRPCLWILLAAVVVAVVVWLLSRR